MQNDRDCLALYVLNKPCFRNDLSKIIVVLRHGDGSLGFNLPRAKKILAALVHDAVVIERANHPNSYFLTGAMLSQAAPYISFCHVVSCNAPSPELLLELERVRSCHLIQKKNEIFTRNGRPIEPLPSTRFDDWISEQKVIRDDVAQWLVSSCSRMIDWCFSDWGVHGKIMGRSSEELVASMETLAAGLGISVHIVQKDQDMPFW